MAYDNGLAQRVRESLEQVDGISEKKMFGGLCFLLNNNMCCGIVDDRLMARVGPEQYDHCLSLAYCTTMDFTGRPMKGMVYVMPEGTCEDKPLQTWLSYALRFVKDLPPKLPRKKK